MNDPLAHIPFNSPQIGERELACIGEVLAQGRLCGDGVFTKRCQEWIEAQTGTPQCLLTPSCTAALEMAALLSNVGPGDEVIVPSYTFSSTANAFVLRGAMPVFVDIRADTLNLDEHLIEAAVTQRTKVIVPVHYAGVGCEMDAIMNLAGRRGLLVVEDAAQGVLATYKDRHLGSIGHMGTYSFHETKNITSGEGGALLVNDPHLSERALIIREKGTDRSAFLRGQVDKYTWVDIGSSCLPGEMVAAFLWCQLERAAGLTERRLAVWRAYHEALEPLERAGVLRRPVVPDYCRHNAHMYYILVGSLEARTELIAKLRERGISAPFHYVPLHSSRAGRKYGRSSGDMRVTDDVSDRLVRLPMWAGLTEAQVGAVTAAVSDALGGG